MRVDSGTIHEQRFSGTADTGAPHLGVHRNLDGHAHICILVDVHVAVAVEVADHRHTGFALDAFDEPLAATRDDDVNVFRHAREHVADGCAIRSRNYLDARFRQSRCT